MSKDSKLVWTSDPEEARRLREKSAASTPTVDGAPSAQTIVVALDRKKRRGKTVTVATGFSLSEKSLSQLAKMLKTKCGAGGSCEPGEIEVQGDHVAVVAGELEKLGYRVKKR